jgi:immune inhibitor A
LFLKNNGENSRGRHLRPSVYAKIIQTKDLIQKGVDPSEFESRGGLDLETYNVLQQNWQNLNQRMEDRKQKVIAKYGSLKAAPISTGPCKKINPVIGTKNALVLLTEFKDRKHSITPDYFKDLLFSKGSNHSLRDFYLEASWDQLDINGDVNNEWYSAANNISNYVDKYEVDGHFPKAQNLISEVVLQAKNSGSFDFSKIAKDGEIEILIVIYAGEGLDTKLNINYIRPHKDSLSEPIEVQEGIFAKRYCLIPELPSDDLGCFCHEVGHFLGLPDLYKEGYSPVVGSWCLMAIGDHIDNGRTPAHPCAWCKIHLGWIEPKILKEVPNPYEISAVMDSDKDIYKLVVDGSDGQEYFLLENRQQKGFEQNLPANGLLIWHVDESVCVLEAPNYNPEHFFLTVKESDGRQDLQRDMTVLLKEEDVDKVQKDLAGDAGDPFPGRTNNRIFDDESTPNSRSYEGDKSLVKVASISDSTDLMKAEMGVGVQPINVLSPFASENVSSDTLKSDKITSDEVKSNEVSSDTVKSDESSQKIINQQFITFITSEPKVEDPYEEGYETGKKDFLEEFKEKEGLKLYRDGYRSGYHNGYNNVLKKLKK